MTANAIVLFQDAKKCDFVTEEALWICIRLERINEVDSFFASLKNQHKVSETLQNLYNEYQEERYRQSPLLRKMRNV